MLNPDHTVGQTDLEQTQEAPSREKHSIAWTASKFVISSVLAIAIVTGGVTTMRQLIDNRPEAPQRPSIERQIPVFTATAQVTTHNPAIGVFGEVVAGRLVDLRALVGGEITAVHPSLEAGRRILEGEALVEIDRFSFEGALVEAQANLAEAEARLAESQARLGLERDQIVRAQEQVGLAERDLTRAQQLAGTGALTDRDVEVRELTVSQRLQSVEQREANLAIEEARLAQQQAAIPRLEWRVSQAERDVERTVLRAPFTGIIRTENVEIGRLISVNDAVATLFDDTALNVRFTLSDSQFGRLAGEDEPLVGRPITVAWSTGGEELLLQGSIERLDADISAATGGVTLFGRLDAADVPNLRPGAFVSVTLDDQAFERTARLPETAVYNNDHIFTVVDDRLVRRDVEFVAWDGSHVLIRAADGNSLDGAEVVTSRMTDAGDGVSVRRVERSAEAAERADG
ncbi:MAG: HlyD family efflux transporter periplasmic adaptor subunit [Pseudomonadota bacterium]